MEDPNTTTQKPEGGCDPCDLGAIDDLHCEAEALEKQSELATEYKTKLEERRPKLAAARAAYTTARDAAKDDVETIDQQLKDLKEQLDCLVKDVDLDCLVAAYEDVKHTLDECDGATTGCCADEECEFDDTVEGVDEKDLLARITEIEKKVKEAEACFDLLVLEPEDIPKRVKVLGDAVTKLLADVCAGEQGDRARLYIRLLVLQQWRSDLWKGFKDANEYYNCLCQALACVVSGRKVLLTLYGALALRQCQQEKGKERCDAIRENLVDEIWAAYVKRCKSEPYPDDGEKEQAAPEEPAHASQRESAAAQ